MVSYWSIGVITTQKRKKTMGIRTKCLQQKRWDLLSCWGKIFDLLARARITLFNNTPHNQPQHLQHQLSFSENTGILESPSKTFSKNRIVNRCQTPGFPFSHAPLMQSIFLWAQHSSPYFHERMVRLLTIAETNKLSREKPTNHTNFGNFKTWVNFLSV